MEEPAAEEEEGVLRDYLAYYAARGAEGRLAACDEAALKARARRLPERRGALDVRGVAERCRRARGRRGGSVLRDLLKALEVLELLCVNLLLSPWRKEIRSLKVGGAAFPRPFPGPRPCPAAASGSGCAGHRRRSDLKTARPFRLASVRGAALFAPHTSRATPRLGSQPWEAGSAGVQRQKPRTAAGVGRAHSRAASQHSALRFYKLGLVPLVAPKQHVKLLLFALLGSSSTLDKSCWEGSLYDKSTFWHCPLQQPQCRRVLSK